MGKQHKVLIMRGDEYDPEKIAGIVKKGMEELDARPSGNILLFKAYYPDVYSEMKKVHYVAGKVNKPLNTSYYRMRANRFMNRFIG